MRQQPSQANKGRLHSRLQERPESTAWQVIPDLRTPDPNRKGITADTVTLEDIVKSFVTSTPQGIRLAHEAALVSASRNWDRHALTGESIFASRGLKDIDDLIAVLEHQVMVAKMFRKRGRSVQLDANRKWLRGINPTLDE